MSREPMYANIREVLGQIIGKRVVDVTQHDENEWEQSKQAFVMLMFEDGSYVKFPIGDAGFDHNCDESETR